MKHKTLFIQLSYKNMSFLNYMHNMWYQRICISIC